MQTDLTDTASDVQAAVDVIRETEKRQPRFGLILGSGLGALADAAEKVVAFETAALPGYPPSTVEGHRGRIVFGSLEGRDVVFLQGRVHAYEGHPLSLIHI